MKKISLLIISLIIITGCSCSKFVSDVIKYQKEGEEYIKIGIEEAKKYISDKYGFDLIDSEIDDTGALSSSYYGSHIEATPPTGEVIINAHHNGVNYKIYVDAKKKNSNEYYDNYEKDIIKNDLSNYIMEKLNYNKDSFRLFTNDNMFFGIQSHEKYVDLVSYTKKITSEENLNIFIITSNDLDENSINSISTGLGLKYLNVVKINEKDNINTYSFKNDLLPTSITIYSDLFTNGSLFIEQVVSCGSFCKLTKYNIIDLGNNNYLKISNNLKINKISNTKYIEKIKECNKENINSVYSIDNDSNFFSYDLYLKDTSKIIIINGNDVKCDIASFTKDGGYYTYSNIVNTKESSIITTN